MARDNKRFRGWAKSARIGVAWRGAGAKQGSEVQILLPRPALPRKRLLSTLTYSGFTYQATWSQIDDWHFITDSGR